MFGFPDRLMLGYGLEEVRSLLKPLFVVLVIVSLLTACHVGECCVWEMLCLVVTRSQNVLYFVKCVIVVTEGGGVNVRLDSDPIQNQFLSFQSSFCCIFDTLLNGS